MYPAIRLDNVGKRYLIGRQRDRARHRTLADTIHNAVLAPFRNLRTGAALGRTEEFWALRNLSFEIQQGEVVGIIGRNGAGKSTLLKILSRITPPTTGRIELRGRVGSLLEVGTGFHPELNGRENIFLSGSILGMNYRHIREKYDEIVDFSGISEFIDTPVKRYSSGMRVRLAFAVAAHLEPELLLVDEVLAVGDFEFQRKCLGKMSNVAEGGRTVLFVSHNMAAVQNLCQRVVVLSGGKVLFDGPTEEGIEHYLRQYEQARPDEDLSHIPREPDLHPIIRRISFRNARDQATTAVPVWSPLTVQIDYEHIDELLDPHFGLTFETHSGAKVFWVQTRFQLGSIPRLAPRGTVTCHIPQLPLLPGTYFVTPGCGNHRKALDRLPRACQLTITPNDVFGTGRLPPKTMGTVLVDAKWTVEEAPADAPDTDTSLQSPQKTG